MPSASFYAPVQSAINNLNQQLNINAAREAERERRGLQRLMTHDDLLARQQQRHLAQKADARADQQLDLAMQEAARAEDWQEFQKLMAVRRDKRAAEEWELGRPAAQLNAKVAEQQLTPAPVNLYEMYPENNSWLANEEAADLVSGIFGGSAKVDPTTGDVYNVHSGEQLQLAPYQTKQLLPAISGIAMTYSDPERARAQQTQELHGELKQIQSELKKFSDNASGAKSGRFKAQIAQLKQKEKALKSRIAGSVAAETPANLYNEYKRRGQMLRNSVLYMMRHNVNPEVINFMQNAINNNNSMMEALIKAQGETAGSKNTQQRFAIHPNTGDVVLLNTPKTMPGAMKPIHMDENLEGYQWMDAFEQLNKTGSEFTKDAFYYVDDYINTSRGILPTMPEQQAFGRMVKREMAKLIANNPAVQKAISNETTGMAWTTAFLDRMEQKHNNAFEKLLQIEEGINPQTGEPFQSGIDQNTGERLSAGQVQARYMQEYRDHYAKELRYVPSGTLDQGSMAEHLVEKWAER